MITVIIQRWFVYGAVVLGLLLMAGCQTTGVRSAWEQSVQGRPSRTVTLETTGYCPCGSCCGWKRNWLGRPVVVSGPGRGNPKKVGYTSSGTKAQPGTLAADTTIFPFGTIMYIPGYGYGRVEDRGSDIKGYHIDLFFTNHASAERWGRIKKPVKVWIFRRK